MTIRNFAVPGKGPKVGDETSPMQRLPRKSKQSQRSLIFGFSSRSERTNEGKEGEMRRWSGRENQGIWMVMGNYITHHHGNKTYKLTIMLAEVI